MSIEHELRKHITPTLESYSHENPNSSKYLSIATAEVIAINTEELSVRLRIKNANEDIVETPLTFSSIGRRHFFGAMPQIGDVCVCGWAMEGEYKKAIILNWLPVGTLFAQDWLTTSSFSKDEYDLNSPTEKARLEGAYNFIRHKMRSLSSGDVVLSSSKGADILLDEDVIINNRHANEIQLRDSDQTIVFRALREQHTLGGTKVLSGIVQRDAHLLPTQMVSDGRNWNRYGLVDSEGFIVEPPTEENTHPMGTLTPHPIFELDKQSFFISNEVRPNVFLSKAGLVQNNRFTKNMPYRVYGGKYFHRVESEERNLTEYRVEVTHTTTETLPVDESTEGFGSDSLLNKESPFVEFVLGTAIGNDPFTTKGSNQYGKPLTGVISSQGTLNPSISVSNDINEHLAYLLKVQPLRNGVQTETDPFFSAVTKNGRALLNVTGEGTGAVRPSAEVHLASGLELFAGKMASGKSIILNTEGSIDLNMGKTISGVGLNLNTSGGLRFESSGSMLGAGNGNDPNANKTAQDMANAIEIVAGTNLALSSGREMRINAASGILVKNTDKLDMTLNSRLSLETEAIDIQAKESNFSTNARATYTYSGPKNSLPSNFPLRETKLTSIIPNPKATVDSTEILVGEKETRVKTTGAVRTIVNIGEIEQKVNVGTVKLSSGVNTSMTLSAASLIAKSSFVSVSATGSLALSGTTSVSISSGGLATVQGSAIILSTTTTTFAGGILTSGTINPMTGTPFAASGCFGNPSTSVI